ncbi:MAG TPA: HyaD/HybD family hydrogenase maturation endopeptidase [Chloroflexota bacterium]|nr:HyaD/HybD family hydrogenase maturation endopeptidase [Chloroflexota bacterium]
MRAAIAPAVVVLGLGNLLLSDEGVGVRALERLQTDPRLPAGLTLIDGGTLGLELLSCAAGATHLLVLDAVDVAVAPGTIVRLTGEALAHLPGGASVHQLGVADLLAALRLMGQEPAELVLLGVQPAVLTLGAALSPPVAAALAPLVEAALTELTRWGQTAPPMEERCTKRA